MYYTLKVTVDKGGATYERFHRLTGTTVILDKKYFMNQNIIYTEDDLSFCRSTTKQFRRNLVHSV